MATALRVASVEPGAVPAGNQRQRAQVIVRIADDLGRPAPGTTVEVTLTGAITERLTGLTDAGGVATVTSTQSARVRRGGTLRYQACVTAVTGPLPYDQGANAETCDSR